MVIIQASIYIACKVRQQAGSRTLPCEEDTSAFAWLKTRAVASKTKLGRLGFRVEHLTSWSLRFASWLGQSPGKGNAAAFPNSNRVWSIALFTHRLRDFRAAGRAAFFGRHAPRDRPRKLPVAQLCLVCSLDLLEEASKDQRRRVKHQELRTVIDIDTTLMMTCAPVR